MASQVRSICTCDLLQLENQYFIVYELGNKCVSSCITGRPRATRNNRNAVSAAQTYIKIHGTAGIALTSDFHATRRLSSTS